MKRFNNLEDLAKSFENGGFVLDPIVVVNDIPFHYQTHSATTIAEAVSGKRPMVIYTCENHPVSLIFFWANRGTSLVPTGVISTDKELVTEEIIVEMDGEKITIRPDQLIGDIAMVKFTSLSNPKELQGKVDTGATISSLHADNYKINGNTVTFTCQPLGPHSITVPLKTQHAVKSPDGGTHYRPVVILTVKVNGKLINNVEFNLNDRGNMDQPVLIGQNLLQAGKFFVDSAKREVFEPDWIGLEKLVEEIKLDEPVEQQTIAELYQQMLKANINFGDLVRYIKGEVTKTELEY